MGPVIGSLRLVLPPGQWRAGPPPPIPLPVPLDEHAELAVQLVARTLRTVVDEQDRPTGWVAAQAWWHRDGEVAPDLVRLLVRAEALPDGAIPVPAGGDR
ncbi:MAG: hypothetical protein ACRDT2_05755 [Natronosporangium sp.]